MSAVLKMPRETRLTREWRRMNRELDRFEREHGRDAPGWNPRLEKAFSALVAAIRAEEMRV